MKPSKEPLGEDDVIIESHRVGAAVKVTAMEPRTLTEVTIVGPATASESDLTQLVMRKLEYVLAKKRG